MKKQMLFCSVLLVPFFSSFAQNYTAKITEQDDPSQPISVLSKEDLDDYEVSIHISGDVNNIDTYDIDQTIYINGEKTNIDPWVRYSKSDDGEKIEGTIDVGEMIESYRAELKEKGNRLKIEFLNKDDKYSTLCSVALSFDVPGFNDYASDFCGELFNQKSTDPKVDKTLHTIFKAVYPHTEIVATLMQDEWDISEKNGDYNTYIIIFKNKGKMWFLRYSASYVVEDGQLLDMPRVKIYNGLDTPVPLAPSCYENLKTAME